MAKRKKKKFKLFIFLILLGLIGFIIYGYYNKDTDNSVFNEVITIIKTKSLKGTIISKEETNFRIITENDTIYSFNEKTGFNINTDIEIKYTGDIDKTKENQNIKIDKINETKIKDKTSKKVKDILNNMTAEEKIGQMLLVRVPSTNKIEAINTYHLGGYLLFRRDVIDKEKEDLTNYINDFQKESTIPLFIAIDEEGGTVSRLSNNEKIVPTPFRSPQDLYNEGGLELIKKDQIEKSSLLKELGFNLNLSPVADTCTTKDAYMYNRSFGKDSNSTSKFIKAIYETQTDDVSYVLKHFPGYGNNVDTHAGISIDDRTLDYLKENDFLPFQEGINNGAHGVLIAHNILTNIDDKPASLSTNIHNILRNELNFDEVIITDDLAMDAIKEYETISPYVDAVLSGNNIIIASDIDKAYNDILDAYKSKIISDSLLDHLVTKVLNFKEIKNMI